MKVNRTLILAGILILISVFFSRYRSDRTGFPGFAGDVGSHVSIINYIKMQGIFPTVNEVNKSPHMIAWWLPIYHGIIGSHLEANLISTTFGTTISKAMLIAVDFSLLLLIIVLFKIVGKCNSPGWSVASTVLCFGAFAFPMYSKILAHGFFSQAVSLGFYALTFLLIINKKLYRALLTCAIAGVCYPDGLMWFLPTLILSFAKIEKMADLRKQFWPSVFGIILPVGLLVVQAFRLLVSGTFEPISFFFLPTFGLWLLLRGENLDRKNQSFLILENYMVVLLIITLASICVAGDIEYYALKNFIWAPFIICFYLPVLRHGKSAAGLIVFSALLFYFSGSFYNGIDRQVELYLHGRGMLSAKEEKDLLSISNQHSCKRAAVVPLIRTGDTNGGAIFLAGNSFFSRVEPYSLYFIGDQKKAPIPLVNLTIYNSDRIDELKAAVLHFSSLALSDCLIFKSSSVNSDDLQKIYGTQFGIWANQDWLLVTKK